jgi:hypothetical protein
MFWPLSYDDTIDLEGVEGGNLWQVNRSSAGWYLHRADDRSIIHPAIHSIDGMSEFIGAILEWAKAYST